MARNGTADRTRHIARIDRYNRLSLYNPHFLTFGCDDGRIEAELLVVNRRE